MVASIGNTERFINQIFTAEVGKTWVNSDVKPLYEAALDDLPLDDAQGQILRDAVHYFLLGERSRQAVSNWQELTDFASRASTFEIEAEAALKQLAEQITSAVTPGRVVFDAILTTTATGNLMPGLSYRMARHLGALVKPNSLFLDLGNVGCTGSLKAINLAHALDSRFNNMLVIALEFPTTLVDLTSTDPDVWQGNCTFGDGAAALWLSSVPDQGEIALRLEELQYIQQAVGGLDLIHWGYGNYYTFKLANNETFNRSVQAFVNDVLTRAESAWRDVTDWAIHPAGITIMMRLRRKLGLSKAALGPSTAHFKRFSNMSSAGIIHILKDLSESVAVSSAINLLTMGAGFNVIYGQVRKER